MTEAEVEAVFKAKPLASGKVEAGQYKVYGSDELTPVYENYYTNVLLVFQDGGLVSISCFLPSSDWRRDLAEVTLDLTEPPRP